MSPRARAPAEFRVSWCGLSGYDTDLRPTVADQLAAIVSVCFYVGHAYVENGDEGLDRFRSKHADLVSHLHVHDVRGRGDTHLPIGAGEVDFDVVADHLDGFDHTVAVEVFADDVPFLHDAAERIVTRLGGSFRVAGFRRGEGHDRSWHGQTVLSRRTVPVSMPPRQNANRFADREDAGSRLAAALRERDVRADVVLAIPRGGLPLGRAVADALDAPLDVVVASKIGAPDNPEFAIGAVGSDGTTWLDEDTIRRIGVDDAYVEREREHEARAAREKTRQYRREERAPDLAGEAVALVDDGAATGSTAIAAARLARVRGAERVVVALPVAPPGTVRDLEGEADAVVCLSTPGSFRAVGQFYDRFGQVPDEEAIEYLR